MTSHQPSSIRTVQVIRFFSLFHPTETLFWKIVAVRFLDRLYWLGEYLEWKFDQHHLEDGIDYYSATIDAILQSYAETEDSHPTSWRLIFVASEFTPGSQDCSCNFLDMQRAPMFAYATALPRRTVQ